jgi:tetratricopeptide (TPR) repeat protein
VAADSFIGVHSSLTPTQGRGGAARKRYWFVWDCGDEGYRVQALNGAFVPQGEAIAVDATTFAASFSLEPTILAAPLSRAGPASSGSGEGRSGEGERERAEAENAEAEKNLRAHFAAQLVKALHGEKKRSTMNALKAIAEIEEGIAPEHKHMFVDFCISLRRSNLPEIALEHAKRVLSMAPDDGNAHFNIARVYHALGKLDEAEQHLLTSLDLDPQLEYSKEFLAYIGKERRLKGRNVRRREPRR